MFGRRTAFSLIWRGAVFLHETGMPVLRIISECCLLHEAGMPVLHIISGCWLLHEAGMSVPRIISGCRRLHEAGMPVPRTGGGGEFVLGFGLEERKGISMAKRFYDIPYYTFSNWSDMAVVCPKCGKAGSVHVDRERGMARFQCESCYEKKETASGGYTFEVTARCTATGRRFRVSMPASKVHGQKVRVKCPYCKETAIGDVSGAMKPQYVFLPGIRHAKDPYFQYPLYFQASYRGKLIWALNRKHLQYLIDYLEADLRTVQAGFHETYKTMRTQSDMLPAFMKTAKNRKGIVKLLHKLQAK